MNEHTDSDESPNQDPWDDDTPIDFLEILHDSQAKDPEWWARYGKASWLAALVVSGEVSTGTTWEQLPLYLGGTCPDPEGPPFSL